jgi:hypothetical protein
MSDDLKPLIAEAKALLLRRARLAAVRHDEITSSDRNIEEQLSAIDEELTSLQEAAFEDGRMIGRLEGSNK